MNFDQFEVLSFDCYGTLIDWEQGIISALRTILTQHSINLTDTEILETYAAIESPLQKQAYQKYRVILEDVVREIANQFEFDPTPDQIQSLPGSIRNWLPFSDTVAALQILKQKFKLAIISNIDDDLFALTARHLQVPFDWIITAEQVRAYKPSLRNFEIAQSKMGISSEKWLHVAQSLYHDIVPAQSLKLTTVWVNRRHDQQGFGATPAADVKPDLEVPDLQTLAAMVS